ncbi:MAG: hypothetical protein AVDCRST_MAG27-3047, partial [uncultured Craurococcus sp.]
AVQTLRWQDPSPPRRHRRCRRQPSPVAQRHHRPQAPLPGCRPARQRHDLPHGRGLPRLRRRSHRLPRRLCPARAERRRTPGL